MRKFLIGLVLLGFVVLPALACADERNPLTGDFSGPPETLTVSQVVDLPDGEPVTMVGRIEQSLGDELHRFSDLTGTTTISINYADEDILSDIGLNEIVEIKGRVKRNFDDFYVVVDQIIRR